MTKSLANKLYLKNKLYTFYMPAGRKISEHIDEFCKFVLDLANIKVKFEDEDLALLLLTSLSASYEHFMDTLLYGHEALTLEDVMATLNLKKIKERSKAKGGDGEGLYVRGRTDRIDLRQSRGKSRSKSRGGRLKCYICQSEDHLKKNCLKNNRKKSTGYVKKDEQPSSSGSTYDDSEVIMVMSVQAQALLDWIMDSRCSYHMTPKLDILFYFLECDRGNVQLRNNRKCKIRGIGKVRVQLKDGLSFVLHNFRYIPELKKNLISLGTHEKEGYTVKLQSGKVKVINGSRVILSRIRTDNCVYSLDGHAQSGLPKTFWVEATCTAAYLINRSPSRAIEKKTPMEMWSGHPSDYGMLRIFGCVLYPHDKQGKLKPRAVKCFLLGHPKGVKGYRLYRLNDESPKIVTSRNVIFNESVMYKDTLKDSGAGDKSVEELQVEVELQRLNNHTPKEDQTDQEDDEDAVACEDSSKWKAAMKEEMNSLKKNKTWKLVDHPAGQKLVSSKWLFKIKEGIEDNMLIACKSKAEIGSTKSLLKKEFDMKELREAKKILGMKIVRDRSHKILRVSQSGYDSKILNKFRIDNRKSIKMPLGGHYKLPLKDCPVRDCDVERMNIAYAVSVVSKYLAIPGKNHWEAVKWILKYLRGTANVVLVYRTNHGNHVDVTCLVDSDYAKDPDKEAEYMALTKAVKEAIWLKGLLEELGVELNTVAVNCDNQVLEAKTVKVLKVGTEHNDADALTKVKPGLKLQHCLELLNANRNLQVVSEPALEVLPADMEAQTKAELNKKAHNAVILCLGAASVAGFPTIDNEKGGYYFWFLGSNEAVGHELWVDLTGFSLLTQTWMVDFVPGQVVIDIVQCKRDAGILLKRIRKLSMTKDIGARAAVHIFNMISFVIAKGGADEELSDGGSPRVIVYGYDGLPMQPVAPLSPDCIPGPEEPQTPPAPQDEDEHEPMFIQPHDPDYEQPLPPIDSPTAESLGYVAKSDPEEDPEEYEDDETKDGPVDYPMDGVDDGDDDDGDSSGDDADNEDEDEEDEEEEEEEHLASADSAIVIPTVELVSPHEGTEPVIPPPSIDTTTTGARITVRLQAAISLPPETEVERLLAMPTLPPSPLTSLSPPSAGERLAWCTALSACPSLPPLPSPLLRSYGCPTQIQTLMIAFTQALIDAVTAALPSLPLPPPVYIPPPVERRDDVPNTEMPHRNRLCLFTLGSRYEVEESSTARSNKGEGIDYGFVSIVDAEARRRGIGEVGYGIRDTWVDPAEAVPEIAPMTLRKRVDLLMEDRIAHQETILIVEEEAYAAREAWAHSIGLSHAVHSEFQTHREQVYTHEFQLHANQTQLQLQGTLIQTQYQMIETLRVMGDMRREICDMQAELLALQEQPRRARQPGSDARVPDHQDAPRDTDNAALTWWNSQIRSLCPDAYSMTWEVLKKKMTDKYCPKGEIKKLEIELWNLKVKGNDVPTYTERFQELTLICTKFVANETEKIDKYISRHDNIYRSVKSSKPKTLDETIELANDFMDQKLRTYVERQTNKRKADDLSRNNHGHQQQPAKRQNVAKVYNMGLEVMATLTFRGTIGQFPRGMAILNVEPQGISREIVQNKE
nr:zinc finger, CCHC-type [Tanacetum cinerariifolium]GEW84556.1 zinc finger, CCHC-type [Tanacetum cinerariifolium]